MYENEYGNYWIAVLGSVCGSIAFFFAVDLIIPLMKKVKNMNCLIAWINRNSIIMFPIHLEVLFVLEMVLNKLIPNVILAGFAKTIITMLLMVPIISVINWYKK